MNTTTQAPQCPVRGLVNAYRDVMSLFRPAAPTEEPVVRQQGDTLGQRLGNPLADLIPCPIIKTGVNIGALNPDKNGNVSTAEFKTFFKDRIGITPLLASGLVAAARAVLCQGGPMAKVAAFFFGKTINVYTLKDSVLMHNADTGAMRDKSKIAPLVAGSTNGPDISGTELSHYQAGLLAANPGKDGLVKGTAELSALVTALRDGSNGQGDNHAAKSAIAGVFDTNTLPEDFHPQGLNAFNLGMQIWRFAQAKKD